MSYLASQLAAHNLALPPKRKKSISLTALIDVVFILLMFFMLTSSFTPFSAVEMQSALAASATSELKPQQLRLGVEGQLQGVDGANAGVTLSDSALAQWDNNAATVVLPAANTSVQKIVDSLARLQALGFTRVTLAPLAANSQEPILQKPNAQKAAR
ncbi:ExbD/TolR family protein [Marinagarivorans algicola]|uniref:ExbD/TolR family protein n=1 Tax=Marinagarivorans algicola TaxID=1513270 RepID=UPI0009EC1FFE|nr:biopolymer transporter ExbD [Marinagarivorans algicola]